MDDEHSQEKLPNYHTLLAQNDEIIRKVLADALEFLGQRVVAVRSSHEALGLPATRQSDFDLLVTAFSPPELDGIDLAFEARRCNSNIMIALVTPCGRSVVAEAVRVGMVDFIIGKPFQTREIEAVITALSSREFYSK